MLATKPLNVQPMLWLIAKIVMGFAKSATKAVFSFQPLELNGVPYSIHCHYLVSILGVIDLSGVFSVVFSVRISFLVCQRPISITNRTHKPIGIESFVRLQADSTDFTFQLHLAPPLARPIG